MGIEKAVLINLNTREKIPVMFNPEEYSLESGNTFAELAIPGSRVPPIQFGRGVARTLKMDLFFDTSSDQSDVRRPVGRVLSLLDKDPATLGPPVVLFLWGGVQFKCVLERVSQKMNRFMTDGTPLRANLSVSFKEYQEVVVTTEFGLAILPPTMKTIGDSVASEIASRALGNPARWREVAVANKIDNPRKIPAGILLRLPNGRLQ